jgi:hypothetical protein
LKRKYLVLPVQETRRSQNRINAPYLSILPASYVGLPMFLSPVIVIIVSNLSELNGIQSSMLEGEGKSFKGEEGVDPWPFLFSLSIANVSLCTLSLHMQ